MLLIALKKCKLSNVGYIILHTNRMVLCTLLHNRTNNAHHCILIEIRTSLHKVHKIHKLDNKHIMLP